ncbi:hypothetical protein WR25_23545 [Diploscapter pachys]|uniref:Uncharacterized protein n=1 Tax=Diploscapter pachys TaxID=2018661 RepID=A0A2A2LIT0_9BILA|nr:hypothetical protein WR25_23545 [Diploscapter pachys]
MEDGVKLSERDWKGQGTEGERARARAKGEGICACAPVCWFFAQQQQPAPIAATKPSPAQPSQAKPSPPPYVRPKPASQIEDWKCDDGPMIEEELKKQQALLNVLHQQITIRRESGHETKHLEDQLWGVQTAITALKRRFKASSEPVPPIKAADGGTRPCREMFEEKQLMATKSQLREELMEERRNIARCLWKLEMADEDWKSLNRPRSQQNKSAIEREIDEWKEKCELEEAAREALVDELVRLRTECSVLRALIEIQLHSKNICARF